eukprot:SAG31_NODE_598_length_13651_cov_10.681818_2_plen_107_part_00
MPAAAATIPPGAQSDLLAFAESAAMRWRSTSFSSRSRASSAASARLVAGPCTGVTEGDGCGAAGADGLAGVDAAGVPPSLIKASRQARSNFVDTFRTTVPAGSMTT